MELLFVTPLLERRSLDFIISAAFIKSKKSFCFFPSKGYFWNNGIIELHIPEIVETMKFTSLREEGEEHLPQPKSLIKLSIKTLSREC